MTVTYMEIRSAKREPQRRLELDKGLRDALADLCRRRWPSGTAKAVARAFDLSLDQARAIVAAKGSLSSLEQVLKNGGWQVVFPLLGEVIGQSAEQYLIEARKSNEENGERLASLASNLWALGSHGPSAPDDLADRQGQRRRSFNRRVG